VLELFCRHTCLARPHTSQHNPMSCVNMCGSCIKLGPLCAVLLSCPAALECYVLFSLTLGALSTMHLLCACE
jgi:hypothetical protein